MTTQFEKEGRTPILTEAFNDLEVYDFTLISGQLSNQAGNRFVLLAHPDNANNVMLGTLNNITFPLAAGVGISLEIENLNQVYAYVQSGDKLNVMILKEV
jgi:hypothetical protein